MARIAAKATKGKGKRWQRGQSSSSNPENRKHRAKVATAGTNAAVGQSTAGNGFKLTKDLLEKLDKINQQRQRQAELTTGGEIHDWIDRTKTNSKPTPGPFDDAASIANTVATVWTNVSNVSFNKFLTGFDAKSNIHRSMLSVLATVREAIAHEQGNETETEYFAALMLALNVVDSEEKMTATLALIQLILRRVPVPVLKLKFAETSSALMKIFSERSSSPSPNIYLLKSVVESLGVLLKHQERAVWELSSTQRIFDTLLLLLLHVKPRVRKAAGRIVVNLITDEQCPGAPITRKLLASFAIRQLEAHLSTTEDVHLNIVLYIFSVLGYTMHLFPSPVETKKVCETILSHVTLGNVLIVTAALQTFHSFFAKRPQANVLSPDLNGKLVTAFYDYQPNINDAQPLSAWCTALKEALLSLAQLDIALARQHLMKFTKTLVGCLQSDSVQVHVCICSALEAVFSELVVTIPKNWELTPPEPAKVIAPPELAAKLYLELEQVLKYQYSSAWVHAIRTLGALLVDDPVLSEANAKVMQRLGILHDSNDEAVNRAIDQFFAQAVRLFGPRTVLASCPIEWRASEAAIGSAAEVAEFCGEFSNPWLLTILRQHLGGDKVELSIWIERFLPMADAIWARSINCAKYAMQLKDTIESKMMDIDGENNEQQKRVGSAFAAHESCLAATKELKRCVHALWSLLPSFARAPVDGPKVFGKIAKKLGETMYKKEFVAYPLGALKNLLKTDNDGGEMVKVVGKFAKNFLPILFNIYSQDAKPEDTLDVGLRPTVLNLVGQLLPLLFANEVGSTLFGQFYRQIGEKLAEANLSDFRRNALLDLQRAFLMSPKGLEVSDIEALYADVGRMLVTGKKVEAMVTDDGAAAAAAPVDENTARAQKNGLRILEDIIKSKSPACEEFINTKTVEILAMLFAVLGKPKHCRSPSTRALALRCLQRLVEQFGAAAGADGKLSEWRAVFERLLPVVYETLLLKSAKAVKAAREMLLMLADAFQALAVEGEGNEDDQFQLIKMLLEPVVEEANNNQKMSLAERTARLAAIVYLYCERYHHPEVPSSVECHIADFVLSEMQNEQLVAGSRQVLEIGFNFLKTFVSKATQPMLESYIEAITCTITKVPAKHRLKFRMRIRVLLIKLIRKFGFDLISKMALDDYQKVLKNIRKEEVRKKKKKADNDDDDEDDDDGEDNDDAKSRRSRRHKTSLFDSDDEDEIEQFVENDWGEKMEEEDEEDEDNGRRKKTQPKFDLTSRLSNKTTKSYIREMADDDPIDLLDPSTSKNVFSKIPNKYRSTNTNQAAGGEDHNDETMKLKTLPTSSDGRIIIKDLLEQIEKRTPSDGTSLKRKAEDKNDSDDEDDDEQDERNDTNTVLSYRPGGRGIHRPVSVAGSKRSARSGGGKSRAASMISRGDVYSSKSARGDMKRRGRPDPYAYYPLNPIATNKRKTQKYKGEFKALVAGAKKGRAAGVRMKNKRKKTN